MKYGDEIREQKYGEHGMKYGDRRDVPQFTKESGPSTDDLSLIRLF